MSQKTYVNLGSTSISPISTIVYLPENVIVGSKTLSEFVDDGIKDTVDNKLAKITKDYLDHVVTQLPTDKGLSDKEFLIIKVEVGDMPKDQVETYLDNIVHTFKKQGLSKVIVYPTYHGQGEMDYTRLNPEDTFIE